MRDYIGLAAGLVGAVGYVPYVRDIVRGRARPDRASWFIWSLQYVLLFCTQIAGHGANTLWLPGLQLLGVLVVAGLAVRYGMGVFDRRTVLLTGGVVAALGLWCITKNATIALCISLGIEAVGVALTAYKAYCDPASETLTMWSCVAIGALLDTAAVHAHAPRALYIYPIALALMNGAVVGAQLAGRRAPGAAG